MIETALPDRRNPALASRTGDNVTTPRSLKLTINDLELLDRQWSKDDRYHSTELIDGRIYHTPARY